VLPGVVTLVLLALLLLAEPLLVPGNVLLPLTPDDFPAWQAGRDPSELQRHPHPNWCMSDVLHLLIPGLQVNAQAFAKGELPLWDGSQALGLPHLHQVHYGVLYPPAWLPVALGMSGLAWMACLHLLVAGLGMLTYLRTIGRSASAATLGALAFAFSAWVTARLQSFPVVGAAVWAPWVLWGLEQGALTARLRPRLLAAVALGLSFLAGFPQISLWVLVLALVVELVRAVVLRWQRQAWRAPLMLNAGALALGLVLAVPQLLPTLDYLRHDSLRTEQTPAAVASAGLEAPLLWHLLIPDRYASVAVPGLHPLAILDLEQAQLPGALNRAETSMSVGVVGLLLACLAILFGRGWRTRTYALLAVVVLTLLTWSSLLEAAATVLPLLRFGNPKRLLMVSTFALAVLAAGGLDLLRGHRLRVTVTGWGLAILLAAAALVARLSVPSAVEPQDIDYWAGRIGDRSGLPGMGAEQVLATIPADSFRYASQDAARGAWLALAVAVLTVVLVRPKRRPTVEGWETRVRTAPWLLVAVLVAELLAGAWPMLRAADVATVSEHPGRIGALRRPELAALALETGQADAAPPRIARFGDLPPWLRPDLPGLFGLSDLQCYAPMAPRRLTELLDALEPGMVLSGSAIGGFRRVEALQSPLVDLLGVTALLTDREDLQPDGWSERGRVGAVRVLANDEVLPRAFVAPVVEVHEDPGPRLERLVSPFFDPRRVAVLEDVEQAALVAAWDAAPADETLRGVTIESYAPGSLELRVEEGSPGVLVLGEGWHDGWRAREGDRELVVWRADHALLALPIENRYEHRVTLRFDPPLVRGALWTGGVGWAATLLGLLLLGGARRRVAGGA
jgi:hypothetical protein